MTDFPRLPGPGNDGSDNHVHRDDGRRRDNSTSSEPDDGSDGHRSSGRRRTQSRHQCGRQTRRRGHVPEIRQIMEAMAQLPHLVTLRIISPQQSNAILAIMRTMLGQLQGSSSPATSQAVPPGLHDAIRNNPELFNFLAAWLPAEQLAELIDDDEADDEAGETNDDEDSDGT